jgi:hypothetical protein
MRVASQNARGLAEERSRARQRRPWQVVYGRFCKKPERRGHGMRVMIDVTEKDAHHAPRQA